MKIIASIVIAGLLSGCAGMVATSENLEGAQATLTPRGAAYQD
ncbi:MAG TPA: curli production assembly/transport protein CsgG, partial [Halomonas sp.]|nr:curli production assembly/transport protein CsgG [Halomonas sp.]